ncbi:hypothetical protein PAXINDRAFT_15731 [Paxillus involutus ATCC 200175]|uniref:Uncharacterized protein n=1 Tax=Paxillus involutus ATCC 200175 TaxID=664439 RepID=A0A0C9TU50_PAXIN|nr:hypothetical protein PAXINDRAFT_15731 [Paxillus involutus ATCC 200175]
MFAKLTTLALAFRFDPQHPTGSTTGGVTDVTWIPEVGDPDTFSLELVDTASQDTVLTTGLGHAIALARTRRNNIDQCLISCSQSHAQARS